MGESVEKGTNPNGAGQVYTREDFAGKGRLAPILCVFLLILPIALLTAAYMPQADEEAGLWIGEVGDTGAPIGEMMDIEDIWAIEDERTESETPLVMAMFNGRDSLGYDAASATFYCTLGLGNEIDWPELSLTAKGVDGVQVVWVDDYSYDWCSDAVSGNVRYELLAYTQTEFSYIGIVFTGLPIVTLHAPQEIGWEDIQGEVHISGAGYESVHSMALLHQRGGGYQNDTPKRSYHIELHTRALASHEKKSSQSVLGMSADTDWLLISNSADPSCIRNELAWRLWRDWVGQEGITPLQSRLAEVFVNDAYMGVYQVMQRIDADRELLRMGGNLQTDIVGRRILVRNHGSRPRKQIEGNENCYIELRYAPQGMTEEQAFDVMMAYIALEGVDAALPEDDEVFAAMELAHMDIESLLNHFLFIQATALVSDNITNNVYIWALRDEEGSYTYRVSPWDMDQTYKEIFDSRNVINPMLTCAMRILELDVGGSRALAHRIWKEKRETILEDETFYALITDLYNEVQDAGAYLREDELYGYGAFEWEMKEIREYAVEHLNLFDAYMKDVWPVQE